MNCIKYCRNVIQCNEALRRLKHDVAKANLNGCVGDRDCGMKIGV